MSKDDVILECDFAFKCPKQWDSMVSIENDPSKKYCPACEKEVFFVTTRAEFNTYKKLGKCVAANVPSIDRAFGVTIAGAPNPIRQGAIKLLMLGQTDDVEELSTALAYKSSKNKHLR